MPRKRETFLSLTKLLKCKRISSRVVCLCVSAPNKLPFAPRVGITGATCAVIRSASAAAVDAMATTFDALTVD